MPTDIASSTDKRYLHLLSEKFPSVSSAVAEIINLEAILNLPKGTEHFISDIHGEYEAFEHILNNCSGVIRERIHELFGLELTAAEQDELCTLIYYPQRKLTRLQSEGLITEGWYAVTLMRLVRLTRRLSACYTRSKVRKALPSSYAYIVDELLHALPDGQGERQAYRRRIIDSIVDTGSAPDFVEALCDLIKRLAVDHMHIVGDIFDRGPHANRILDRLMQAHSLDIQWGNHDIVWMGAAAGSSACLAAVIRNNVRYNTLKILEEAYGISLRELALFARSTYRADDDMDPVEKAISIIMFKLEGQVISRHPNWQMEDRLLLHRIDQKTGTITLDNKSYPLRTQDFPTLNPEAPYELSPEESMVMRHLASAVRRSEKLQSHVAFLFEKGSTYRIHNNTLLFHACVPMKQDGTFCPVLHQGQYLSGRAYYDYADRLARQAWIDHDQTALDWMWYLWCGRYSPLSGRVTKTFERTYLTDTTTWHEPRDPYYALTNNVDVCDRILSEFGIDPQVGRIVNGHTPVHATDGEKPVRAHGKLIVIDGGFCKSYHQTTGIAGYTLIDDPQGLRIKAHRPFGSIKDVLDVNADIMSSEDRFCVRSCPLTINDTDTGADIREQISDLRSLLAAYRSGSLSCRA